MTLAIDRLSSDELHVVRQPLQVELLPQPDRAERVDRRIGSAGPGGAA